MSFLPVTVFLNNTRGETYVLDQVRWKNRFNRFSNVRYQTRTEYYLAYWKQISKSNNGKDTSKIVKILLEFQKFVNGDSVNGDNPYFTSTSALSKFVKADSAFNMY